MFNVGNLKTLKHDSIRGDLINFHKTYYSGNLMKVVL
jgi:secreted Zn-dependent insulinase-like peptidase